MVRRMEHALVTAIRDGQKAGEIESITEARSRARSNQNVGNALIAKPRPLDFEPNLYSNGSQLLQMADGVSREDFETALSEAKDEGNVSRANVVRKIKAPSESTYSEQHAAKWDRIATLAATGSASSQIARDVGMSEAGVKAGAKERGIDIRADRVLGRVHRLDSNRIIRESVSALENIISGLDLINPDDIDPEEAQKWIDSLTASRNALSKAIRQIEKRKSIQ